jgi:hypothetical protein
LGAKNLKFNQLKSFFNENSVSIDLETENIDNGGILTYLTTNINNTVKNCSTSLKNNVKLQKKHISINDDESDSDDEDQKKKKRKSKTTFCAKFKDYYVTIATIFFTIAIIVFICYIFDLKNELVKFLYNQLNIQDKYVGTNTEQADKDEVLRNINEASAYLHRHQKKP